ncbi:MAG: DUF6320 domain-containing protein [Oscillospiraceae bacterium]
MVYCVNCGVELGESAETCPLCGTAVWRPEPRPEEGAMPGFFPTRRTEVAPVSKRELALMLTAMLASVAVCCGVLNLFWLRTERSWSLYVIGAALMLWIWFVPPLLLRKLPLWVRLTLDVCAVGVYVLLVSIDLDGRGWFLHLALPILTLAGILLLGLSALLHGRHHSILTTTVLIIGAVGLLAVGIELFADFYFHATWAPGWSLVIISICVALVIPLIVVRRIPSLREEVRRRFHM